MSERWRRRRAPCASAKSRGQGARPRRCALVGQEEQGTAHRRHPWPSAATRHTPRVFVVIVVVVVFNDEARARARGMSSAVPGPLPPAGCREHAPSRIQPAITPEGTSVRLGALASRSVKAVAQANGWSLMAERRGNPEHMTVEASDVPRERDSLFEARHVDDAARLARDRAAARCGRARVARRWAAGSEVTKVWVLCNGVGSRCHATAVAQRQRWLWKVARRARRLRQPP